MRENDASDASSTLSEFADFFSYAAHPATYQCGPLVPYAAFRDALLADPPLRRPEDDRYAAAEKKKPPAEEAPSDFAARRTKPAVVVASRRRRLRAAAAWLERADVFPSRRVLARLSAHFIATIAWIASSEAAMHWGYAPSLSFSASAAGALRRARLPLRVGLAADLLAFAHVSWVTSHVVFGVPWALALLLDGVEGVPHDTPAHWPASSAGFARHWSSFHASLYRLFAAEVYEPLGGGAIGVVASVAVSVAFHGWKKPWVAWGAVNAAGLLIERAVAGGEGTRRGERAAE